MATGGQEESILPDDQFEAHSATVAEASPAASQPTESTPAEATASSEKQPGDLPTRRPISAAKLAANRANAQKSTGPKTPRGKTTSSWNALKHGLLSRRLVNFSDQSQRSFLELLADLRQEYTPVGALEELLLEKIAYEYWRLATVAWYESRELGGPVLDDVVPFDRILRYQASVNRQLFQTINQLERLQRLRRGENVPAPLSIQVSHEITSSSKEDTAVQ